MDYSSFVASFALNLEYDPTSSLFTTMLPDAINYAEGRIFLDLDPIRQVVRDSSATLTASSRNFTIPTSTYTFRTVLSVNVLTPVGSSATTGTRNQVNDCSLEVLDALWPSNTSNTGVPELFCRLNDTTLVFGPAPDAAYTVEVIGEARPAALSASNTTTYLTTTYPELYMAAAMIYGTGFMRNFGQQADDPKMAESWESQYGKLLAAAAAEEKRRREGRGSDRA